MVESKELVLPVAFAFETEKDAKEMKESLGKQVGSPVSCVLASTDGDGVYVYYLKKPEEKELHKLVADFFGLTENKVILDKDLWEF